jgi:hypothetical protein
MYAKGDNPDYELCISHIYIHLTNPCACNSALSARARLDRSVAVIALANNGRRPSFEPDSDLEYVAGSD